jgi:hypothetical protein
MADRHGNRLAHRTAVDSRIYQPYIVVGQIIYDLTRGVQGGQITLYFGYHSCCQCVCGSRRSISYAAIGGHLLTDILKYTPRAASVGIVRLRPTLFILFGSNGSLILRSFFIIYFLMLILYLWIARATLEPHAVATQRARICNCSTVTPVEPPLVETMLVRLSCLILVRLSCVQPCLELSRPKCSVGCVELGGDLQTRSRVA